MGMKMVNWEIIEYFGVMKVGKLLGWQKFSILPPTTPIQRHELLRCRARRLIFCFMKNHCLGGTKEAIAPY